MLSYYVLNHTRKQCFLCRTKIEFTELCARLQDDITNAGIQPLFEIVKTGHTPWITQQRSQAESDVFSTEGNFVLYGTNLKCK